MQGSGLLDADGLEEGWVTKVVVEIKLFRAAKTQADCKELETGIVIPSVRMMKQQMKCNID